MTVAGISVICAQCYRPVLASYSGGLAEKLAWRLRFYLMKARGEVPALSWAEVIQGTWPEKVKGDLGGQRLYKR